MPVPAEYQRATDDFYKLLTDARDSAGLTTTNQAYTMVQGVLQAFRRRLEVNEAIRFLKCTARRGACTVRGRLGCQRAQTPVRRSGRHDEGGPSVAG